MVSTFEALVAPFSIDEFRAMLAARELYFRRGAGTHRYSGFIDWPTVKEVIESGAFPAAKLAITRASHKLPSFIYMDGGKLNATKFANLVQSGASVVAQPIEEHVPNLKALVADIRRHVPEHIQAGIVAQTGGGGAFKIHYDNQDLIVLQLEGTKRWRIHAPTDRYPVLGMTMGTPPPEPIFDEVLEPGDFLFMPAGYWHHCDNCSERSLHGVVFFQPPSGVEAVKALIARLADEELFRMPLTRQGGPEARATHEAALKAELIARIEKMSFAGLIPRAGAAVSGE